MSTHALNAVLGECTSLADTFRAVKKVKRSGTVAPLAPSVLSPLSVPLIEPLSFPLPPTSDEVGIIKRKREKKPVEEPESCNICCQNITKCRRKNVSCPYCRTQVCLECLERYLVTQADANCMSCKKMWSKEFLREHFTKTYINERLTEHYINVLVELEKSLFPETLIHIQREQNQKNLHQLEQRIEIMLSMVEDMRIALQFVQLAQASDRLVTNQAQARWINFNMRGGFFHVVFSSFKDDHVLVNDESVQKYMNKMITTFRTEVEKCTSLDSFVSVSNAYCALYRTQNYRMLQRGSQPQQVRRSTLLAFLTTIIELFDSFTTKAFEMAEKTRNDNNLFVPTRCGTEKCPGYLIDYKHDKSVHVGECKVCSKYQCLTCTIQLPKTSVDTHECDQDLVKTVRLIARQAKPCPNCKAMISRIAGCNQMFCTGCHTAFDWESNQVISGRIHNPHYFDYMANRAAPPAGAGQNQQTEQGQQDPQGQQGPQNAEQPGGCPANRDYVFNDSQYRDIFSHTLMNLLMHYHREVNTNTNTNTPNLTYIVLLNKYKSLIRVWNILNHHIGVDLEQPQANPVERYRRLRVSLLKGLTTEEAWRSSLKAEYRSYEVSSEKRQLLEALVMIGNQIFTEMHQQMKALVPELRALPENVTERQQFKDTLMTPLFREQFERCINETHDKCNDMIRYYNKHLRELSVFYGKHQYTKIFIASPAMLQAVPEVNKRQIYNVNWNLCSERSTPICNNELEYYVDPHTTSFLTSTQETVTDNPTLTVLEQQYIEKQKRIKALVSPILKYRNNKYITQRTVVKLLQSFTEMIENNCVVTLDQTYDHLLSQIKKNKERQTILVNLHSSTLGWIEASLHIFFFQILRVVREFFWQTYASTTSLRSVVEERFLSLIRHRPNRLYWFDCTTFVRYISWMNLKDTYAPGTTHVLSSELNYDVCYSKPQQFLSKVSRGNVWWNDPRSLKQLVEKEQQEYAESKTQPKSQEFKDKEEEEDSNETTASSSVPSTSSFTSSSTPPHTVSHFTIQEVVSRNVIDLSQHMLHTGRYHASRVLVDQHKKYTKGRLPVPVEVEELERLLTVEEKEQLKGNTRAHRVEEKQLQMQRLQQAGETYHNYKLKAFYLTNPKRVFYFNHPDMANLHPELQAIREWWVAERVLVDEVSGKEYKVKCPRWLVSLLDGNSHLFFNEARVHAGELTCSKALFYAHVFGCTINDTLVTPYEFLLLPFLLKREWTLQDLYEMNRRLIDPKHGSRESEGENVMCETVYSSMRSPELHTLISTDLVPNVLRNLRHLYASDKLCRTYPEIKEQMVRSNLSLQLRSYFAFLRGLNVEVLNVPQEMKNLLCDTKEMPREKRQVRKDTASVLMCSYLRVYDWVSRYVSGLVTTLEPTSVEMYTTRSSSGVSANAAQGHPLSSEEDESDAVSVEEACSDPEIDVPDSPNPRTVEF